MDYDHIQPRLIVGSYPQSAREIETLRRDEGVTAVLNLQRDEDFNAERLFGEPLADVYAGSGVELCRVPVRDFDESHLRERLPECVASLDRLLVGGHTVYLHCTVGINRSPTVATAYLHRCLGWDLDLAVKHVETCRACSPNMEAIRRARWKPSASQSDANTSPSSG